MANPYEFLAVTKQINTIEEYIREFETRAAQIQGLIDELYLGLFLNGLREDIRVQIYQKDAVDIFEITDLVLEVERRLWVERGDCHDRQRQVAFGMKHLSEPYAVKVDGLIGTSGPNRWPKPNTTWASAPSI